MADIQIISSELKNIGITATVLGVSTNAWEANLAEGDFDLTLDWGAHGPTPYYPYNTLLNYKLSGPVGSSATGDYERWNSPATEQYLQAYEVSGSKAQEQAALNGLEGIMVNYTPVISVMGGTDWGTYTTRDFVGWPTPSNPYADANPSSPNGELVVLRLKPR
jgi:peptide/nickel transport system substrate-binding protein